MKPWHTPQTTDQPQLPVPSGQCRLALFAGRPRLGRSGLRGGQLALKVQLQDGIDFFLRERLAGQARDGQLVEAG
jgi:hypothetical protein